MDNRPGGQDDGAHPCGGGGAALCGSPQEDAPIKISGSRCSFLQKVSLYSWNGLICFADMNCLQISTEIGFQTW